MREVFVDDETKEATVVVPDDQLALAIGKEGLNARLAARLTGWKVDIQSDSEFAQAEAAAAYGGGTDEEFTGRCAAVLSNGKRCPNAALPGSHYCGVAAHQALEGQEPPVAVAEVEAEPIAEAETVPSAHEHKEEEAVAGRRLSRRSSRPTRSRPRRTSPRRGDREAAAEVELEEPAPAPVAAAEEDESAAE